MLRELDDVLRLNCCSINLLDRSSRGLSDFWALWFEGARADAMMELGEYLDMRIRRKQLRSLPQIAAAARIPTETTDSSSVHRYWDPGPKRVEDSVARDTVVCFLLGMLT